MTPVRESMCCFAKPKLSKQTVGAEMLGLSVDKNMIHAAILSDGGDVVSDYQNVTLADSYRNYLLAVKKPSLHWKPNRRHTALSA